MLKSYESDWGHRGGAISPIKVLRQSFWTLIIFASPFPPEASAGQAEKYDHTGIEKREAAPAFPEVRNAVAV